MSLVSEVRDLLGEASAVFWPDQQVYDAINQAQINAFANYPILSTSTSLVVPQDADFITIPPSIMIPSYIATSTGNKFITTEPELEEYAIRWMETTPGEPKHFILWDTMYLRVFPRASAWYTYTIYGVPWPTEIDGSTQDVTNIHKQYRLAIIYDAVSVLFEASRPDLAQAYRELADQYLSDSRSSLRTAHPHNTLRLRPGNKTSTRHRGVIV